MNKLKELKLELLNANRLLPNAYGSLRDAILKARHQILREIEAEEIPFKEELQLCDDMEQEDDLTPEEEDDTILT